jgi:hypothetical protein
MKKNKLYIYIYLIKFNQTVGGAGRIKAFQIICLGNFEILFYFI